MSHVRLANIGQSRDWVTLWAIANVAGKQRARAFIDVLLFSMPVFCQLRSLCLWHLSTCTCTRMHDEVKKVNVVDLYSASTRSVSKALRYIYSTHCQGITQFYLHTLRFISKRNELYLHLPSQPQLLLIYEPRRDGRLSRPWCEVALAEIRTCNLPFANPALHHTATSAPKQTVCGQYDVR